MKAIIECLAGHDAESRENRTPMVSGGELYAGYKEDWTGDKKEWTGDKKEWIGDIPVPLSMQLWELENPRSG